MLTLGPSQYAVSGSTFVVNCAFYDENGSPATPFSASWMLTDYLGVVQNGRSGVAINPIAQTVQIVLSGADILYSASTSHQRVLIVTAIYASSFGSPLPLVDSLIFFVANPATGYVGP